jgi:hypothetical protein
MRDLYARQRLQALEVAYTHVVRRRLRAELVRTMCCCQTYGGISNGIPQAPQSTEILR